MHRSRLGDIFQFRRNFPRALELYQQALEPLRQVDDPRSVAVTLGMMAQAYFASEQPEQAVTNLWQAHQTVSRVNDSHTAQAMAETLQAFKSMLGPERFDAIWQHLVSQAQPDWLANVQAAEGGQADPFAADPTFDVQAAMAAIQAFFGTPDWPAARQALEDNQAVLFHPNVETIFEVNIRQAQQSGDDQAARALNAHLRIIRRAKEVGIEAAFAELEDEPGEAGTDGQPLLAAIQAFVNADDVAARKAAWEEHQALLNHPAVEQIFEVNLQQARQAEDQTVVQRLTAELNLLRQAKRDGIDAALAAYTPPGPVQPAAPAVLSRQEIVAVANNTLAVLTAVRDRESEWRSTLQQIRNTATASGDTLNEAFAGALLDLIDAGGNAESIHPELEGVQQDVWQQLVNALSQAASDTNGDSEGS